MTLTLAWVDLAAGIAMGLLWVSGAQWELYLSWEKVDWRRARASKVVSIVCGVVGLASLLVVLHA